MSEIISGTTSTKVAKRLDALRTESGSTALGRVLTLIAVVRDEEGVQRAIGTATAVTRAHPCRIIVLLPDDAHDGEANLDAEIIVGGDVGLTEVIILRPSNGAGEDQASLVMPLLLPDATVMTWWVQEAPTKPSQTALGRISRRRITDANSTKSPMVKMTAMANHRQPGDTDLSWASITLWRGQVAALIDEPPHEAIDRVEVEGNIDRGGANLLAAWLGLRLGVPAAAIRGEGPGINAVRLFRKSGVLEIVRPNGDDVAYLNRPGRQQLQIPMPRRTLEHLLIEELRTLGDDVEYADTLINGLPLLDS